MYFIIDHKLNIIFGWSAKCGCSHLKKICWYLIDNLIIENNDVHINKSYSQLPVNINKYKIIIIIRNPYERLISGFLEKYNINSYYRKIWKKSTITFTSFVDELVKNNWNLIDKHHFTPQTSEKFDKKILFCKEIKIFDIKNIDYGYLESLYGKKIPEELINYKGNHARNKFNNDFNDFVFDLDINTYYQYNVELKYFFNPVIKNKVYNFYIEDFLFFKNYGFDYEKNTIF